MTARHITTLSVAITSIISCFAKITVPNSLQTGDSIAIISPASKIDSIKVEKATEIIKSWGLVPIMGKYALDANGTYSGTINQRLEDLKWAFENKNIKAIMCTRGGYGSYEVLDLLPKGYFKKYPKWLIGYSDITAVHLAMVNDGVASIHGHMCGHLYESGGTDLPTTILKDILFGKKPEYSVNTTSLNHTGKVKGILIGGNLSLVNDMSFTRIDPLIKKKNVILFIEDIGENIPSVKRIMYHLKLAGILDKIKGLIIGQFTEYKPNADYQTMNEMIADVVKEYNIPIAFDFPTGHVDNNMPLIEGAPISFEVSKEKVIVKYDY